MHVAHVLSQLSHFLCGMDGGDYYRVVVYLWGTKPPTGAMSKLFKTVLSGECKSLLRSILALEVVEFCVLPTAKT